jgi:hypothetical protein
MSFLHKILSNLDPKKATGFDGLSPRILKLAAQAVSTPISSIINTSISTSQFPEHCKKAEIGPVHKKDSLLSKKNYRPVSVLTGISKVMEKCLNDQLMSFCDDVLSPFISAYRKGYSSQYALIQLCETMRAAMDKKEVVGLVLMDLSKAFDSLPHDLITAKLCAYGMQPPAVQLLTSYLRHGQQRVKINSERSDWQTILKGVPQGSILGPCIFNIFFNDFVHFLDAAPINYADDNNICSIGKTVTECLHKCKKEVDQSLSWFSQNQMQANPAKFQFLHTSTEDDVSLTLNELEIDSEPQVKLLGINVDKNLKFTTHVNVVIRKCARQLNVLKRKSRLLNTKTRLLIYHAFIEANFNYCPLVWTNRNRTDMKRLEKINKRALSLVFGRHFTYSELLSKAKTCSLEVRWKRQLVTEVYKAVNGLSPQYICDMFKQKSTSYDLRNIKITQPRFYTQTHGFYSLRQEGTRLWNTLPSHCQMCNDITVFKRKICEYII